MGSQHEPLLVYIGSRPMRSEAAKDRRTQKARDKQAAKQAAKWAAKREALKARNECKARNESNVAPTSRNTALMHTVQSAVLATNRVNVVPTSHHTAMMHTTSYAAPSTSSPAASSSPTRNLPGLPVVDLNDTGRLFAILGDGCNSTCHTESYANLAQKVLPQLGRALCPLQAGTGVGYTGIDLTKSRGLRKMPLGLKMVSNPNSDDFHGYLAFSIMSHEISTPFAGCYMSLSLHAQCKLGLVTDIEAGTVFLKHQNAYVPMYAVYGSHLRAVCISDFEGGNQSEKQLHRRRRRRPPVEEDSDRKKQHLPSTDTQREPFWVRFTCLDLAKHQVYHVSFHGSIFQSCT